MTTMVTAAGLRHDADALLDFKRAMGMTYRRGEFELNRFVRFVAQHWGEHGEVALDVIVKRWCERLAGRKAVTLGNEFGVIRQLCLYRRRRAHKGRFIWALMLRTLILVLYCTGLRLGEAIRLRMTDVDLDRGTLMIRNSK